MSPIDRLEAFALSLSPQPLKAVPHRPEAWATARRCLVNAPEKALRDGGSVQYGWTFHQRINATKGPYLFATHHAVWKTTTGELVDVTPFTEDVRHHPYLAQEGHILFLADDAAQPVRVYNVDAPLPLRYFPMTDDVTLRELVDDLNRIENEKCERIHAGNLEDVQGPREQIVITPEQATRLEKDDNLQEEIAAHVARLLDNGVAVVELCVTSDEGNRVLTCYVS